MQRLIIFDAEEEYVTELAEVMNASMKEQSRWSDFAVYTFTRKEILLDYCKEHMIDILIVAKDLVDDDIKKIQVKELVILTETEQRKDSDITYIFKYQSVDDMIKQLPVHEAEEGIYIGQELCRIYGIYSPVHRCGKTSLALAMAKALSEKAPALFLSMELFSDLTQVLPNRTNMDLGDLMYLFMQGKEDILQKLKRCINEAQGMDYICPVSYSSDLKDINSRNWVALLEKIGESGAYQSVVIDLGEGQGEIWELLNICSRIYMPVLSENNGKVLKFEEFMLKSDRSRILDKVRKVEIPGEYCQGKMDLTNLFWGPMKAFAEKCIEE